MNDLDADKHYAAICPHCKRIVGAAVADAHDLWQFVSEWMRDGLDIQRMTHEEILSGEWRHVAPCRFYRPEKKEATKSEIAEVERLQRIKAIDKRYGVPAWLEESQP